MEPTNDHEWVIARAVDEKILEDPGDSHHSIVRDVAMSLNFIMSPSESEFLAATPKSDSIIRQGRWSRSPATIRVSHFNALAAASPRSTIL